MRNVAPSRVLLRRSRDLLKVAVLTFLFGLLLAVVGAFLFVVELVVRSNPDFPTYDFARQLLLGLGGVLIVLAVIMVIRALTWRTDNELADRTGVELAQHLDERYIFIRNVSKRSIGYIDAVLIGPGGVVVFRITDRRGVFFNDRSRWLVQRDKGTWKTMRWNPTKETVDDVTRLRAFLKERGLEHVPVYGLIVFTEEEPIIQFTTENPVVPVTSLQELVFRLEANYLSKERIDQQTIGQLVKYLYAT